MGGLSRQLTGEEGYDFKTVVAGRTYEKVRRRRGGERGGILWVSLWVFLRKITHKKQPNPLEEEMLVQSLMFGFRQHEAPPMDDLGGNRTKRGISHLLLVSITTHTRNISIIV